jgi:putative ABC transport system ATP-binding protein
MTVTEAILAPATTAVAARDVVRRYGEADYAVDALRGVSLAVPSGQFAAIMGPSGSGKSTLMHILAGLDQPTSGAVEIGGEEITTMGDKELTLLRRRHIGFVFQAFNLVPTLTAEENIVLPLAIAGRKTESSWIEAVIGRVGLGDRRHHRPAQLSGGQQQRVAVARALASEPTVLFADEPTGNLDSHSGAEVLELLGEAASEYGQTIVMVTHDPRAAAAADRVIQLVDGLVDSDVEVAA